MTNIAEAFKEYEVLKLESKKIEDRIKELQPTILSAVPEDAEVKGEYGVFTVQKRAKWKHTDTVDNLEQELKVLKADEIARGDATATYTPTLYWRENKE
jgi:hypothetical protein